MVFALMAGLPREIPVWFKRVQEGQMKNPGLFLIRSICSYLESLALWEGMGAVVVEFFLVLMIFCFYSIMQHYE
jgi:hypothetical protein